MDSCWQITEERFTTVIVSSINWWCIKKCSMIGGKYAYSLVGMHTILCAPINIKTNINSGSRRCDTLQCVYKWATWQHFCQTQSTPIRMSDDNWPPAAYTSGIQTILTLKLCNEFRHLQISNIDFRLQLMMFLHRVPGYMLHTEWYMLVVCNLVISNFL